MATTTTTPLTAQEAARFLNQATMGFNSADLALLMQQGYEGWIAQQFAITQDHVPGHHKWLSAYYPPGPNTDVNGAALFVNSVLRRCAEGKDLLRQKMAFALSQILVVSGRADHVHNYRHIAMGSYMDLLATYSFDRYPDLLAAVGRTALMANYLTFLGSKKTADGNAPDENYAREVQQLFTIGVDVLDIATGLPVAVPGSNPVRYEEAYTSADIRKIAKLFTGFQAFGQTDLVDYYSPEKGYGLTQVVPNDAETLTEDLVINYPYYEAGVKKTYTVKVSKDLTGHARINSFADQLAQHPAVGFFLARQLIQRFVTSNPSAAYVRRVGQAYYRIDSTTGKAHNLGAMVKAILMDESLFVSGKRTGGLEVANQDFGRVREPFARLTQWVRLFGAQSVSGRWNAGTHASTPDNQSKFSQSPLMAKSVFNFYRPNFVYPGGVETRLAAPTPEQVWGGKRVAPELQLVNEYTSLTYISTIWKTLDSAQYVSGTSGGVGGARDIVSSYSAWTAKASNPTMLVAELNLMLASGRINKTACDKVIQAISSMAGSNETDRRLRVQAAAFLLMIAPEYIVQK